MKIVLSLKDQDRAKGLRSAYAQALVAAGAKPEEIWMASAAELATLRFEDFDGVVLGGGEDVDPALYDERKKYTSVVVNRPRDEFELALLSMAMERRLPILGICRGAQVVNVKFGGTLFQDLKAQLPSETEHKQPGLRSETTHSVTLTDPDSLLSSAFRGSCRVNSLHHQAIRRVGRGLKVTAHSEDGLVEAVETAGDYPFLMAVQWHPEEIAGLPEQRKIFEDFLAHCRVNAERQEARAQ